MSVDRLIKKEKPVILASPFPFLLIILNDYLKTISMGLPIQTCGCSK